MYGYGVHGGEKSDLNYFFDFFVNIGDVVFYSIISIPVPPVGGHYATQCDYLIIIVVLRNA